MGYIVDLTIVLEAMFWLKFAQPLNPTLSQDDIDAAFNLYDGADEQIQVHREIRSYVDRMTLIDHAHPDNAHVEVERLIRAHRRNLISGSKFEPSTRRPPAETGTTTVVEPTM